MNHVTRLAAPSALALGVLLTAAWPAVADGSHLTVAHSDGSTIAPGDAVTGDDVLRVTAVLDAQTPQTQLVVVQPSGDGATVASATTGVSGGTTMTFPFNTSCFTYDQKRSPCSGRHPARNGTWTIQLKGGVTESRALVLRVPPAPAQGVTAAAHDTRVTLTWQPGAEPDLTAYDVLDGSGKVLRSGLSPADACANGSCTTSVDLGSGASGDKTFVVRTERATCPTCSDTVTSDSAPVTTHVGSAASPSPTSSAGSGTSSSGGSTGGSATGGSTASGGTTRGSETSSSGAAGAGTSGGGTSAGRVIAAAPPPTGSLDAVLNQYLAPATAASAPDVPSAVLAPLPEGSYKPELAYPDQTVRETVSKPFLSNTRSVVVDVANNHRLWPSLAGALVLLLLAGHLRAWLARTTEH